MTLPIKGLLALALFGFVGVALAHGGVARMQRSGTPPFATGMVTMTTLLPSPPRGLVLQLARNPGRIVWWFTAGAVPICAAVCLWQDRIVMGLLLQLGWSAWAMFFGLWVWLFSVFHRLA